MLNKDIHSLVNDFGQAVTLRKVSSSSYNPDTGTASSTSTDYSVKAYMAQYTLTELTIDNIVRGDRKALLSSFDTSGVSLPSPDEGDLLVVAGDTSRVISTQTIYSGDDVVCYICQVRE